MFYVLQFLDGLLAIVVYAVIFIASLVILPFVKIYEIGLLYGPVGDWKIERDRGHK